MLSHNVGSRAGGLSPISLSPHGAKIHAIQCNSIHFSIHFFRGNGKQNRMSCFEPTGTKMRNLKSIRRQKPTPRSGDAVPVN